MEAGHDNTNTNDTLYKECLRNHAASLGSYATDGCGEFTPDYSSTTASLSCAACGCHRNFHRKLTQPPSPTPAADLIIAHSGSRQQHSPEGSTKKRFRTKFTEEQKDRMLSFAEKLGWRLQRRDGDDEVERFCRGIGITRKVFKVWMHNHKNCPSLSANASSLTDR